MWHILFFYRASFDKEVIGVAQNLFCRVCVDVVDQLDALLNRQKSYGRGILSLHSRLMFTTYPHCVYHVKFQIILRLLVTILEDPVFYFPRMFPFSSICVFDDELIQYFCIFQCLFLSKTLFDRQMQYGLYNFGSFYWIIFTSLLDCILLSDILSDAHVFPNLV